MPGRQTSCYTQTVLIQAMSVHYRPPKCPQGPESISRWMETWVRLCETHPSRTQRGDL